jgi:arsenite methyltransferase
MSDCASCALFAAESDGCLHINRPGGLALTRRLFDLAGLSADTVTLEIASGAGATLNLLEKDYGLRAYGMDLSPAMLRMASAQYSGLRLFRADAGALPVQAAGCGAVVMECAFSILRQSPNQRSELLRAMRPGAKLLVTDLYLREINDPAGRSDLSASPCLGGVLTEAEIRSVLDESGFDLLHWQDESAALKTWLGSLVFKLGSLAEVYRRLAGCESGGCRLSAALGQKIKLGYYLMIAVRRNDG